jgi:hypothetical protein
LLRSSRQSWQYVVTLTRLINFKFTANVPPQQEKLHAINALNVLKKNNAFAPPPCTYNIPDLGIFESLELASTFTSLVMGTLQDASQTLARNGDSGPIRGVGASLGQEGEQNGFYRLLLARQPSQKPFLTTNVAPFAFSALRQNFIATCPFDVDKEIKIPSFPALTVVSGNGGRDVPAKTQSLQFSADLGKKGAKCDGAFVTYFSGQNLPSSWPVKNCKAQNGKMTFEANFPYDDLVMDGLSVAALTNGNNFTSPGAVVPATLAAPGLIQVNTKLT